jgi:perosamine synthetase
MKIPLSKPSYLPYIDEVSEEVDKVLRSGMISMGEKVAEFEQMVADYYGVKHCIAVSSGTVGLYMCLKALGIGKGDEVITSPFSFIASSNAILWAGAKPIFVDIDRNTYNINAFKGLLSDKYANTKAFLPVDVFGNPMDTTLLAQANLLSSYFVRPDLPIILDSCESFGTKMERPFDCAVYAFYPNKQVGMGEGGVIVTNNKDIDTYCRAFRNQGRMPGDTWLESSMIGYNFRLTDIHATIGIVQLKHIKEIIHNRIKTYLHYTETLKSIPEIVFRPVIPDPDKCQMYSPFVFTVEVDNRINVMEYLASKGIDTRAYFPCIHLQKPYRDMGYHEGMYPICEKVASRTLALPFYTDMPESEVDYVCESIKEVLVNG